MEHLKFAEAVIERTHKLTIAGELKWKLESDSIRAEPTPAISVRINFDDVGPDSATWKSLFIRNPVGKGLTMLGNPATAKSHIFDPIPPGPMLDRVNEIFKHVLLIPRQREFEAEMNRLRGL